MIEAGTSVGGYRIVRVIGRGGMGVVYEAVQTSLKRQVALKVLRPELADDPDFVERFRREARLQASLEHPHVLEVYEAGESDQGLFLAMRLVPGQTLLDLLRDGELDAERALRLLDQVTDALDAAHEAALVHRDVKPQNVLIDEADRAFLADFGLTRTGTDTTVATSRPMLGSVAYVAPEIVRGEEPTPASDRYSFAATVFHCLTGDVVFPRGSDAAVLYAHATEPPPTVGERRSELPEELDGALGPALAKRPETRPRSSRSIIQAVRDALGDSVSTLGSPQVVSAYDRTSGDVVLLPPVRARPAWVKATALIAILAAAAALGTGAAVFVDDDEAGSAEEVPLGAVPPGAQALGSDLAPPERAVDCRGEAPTPASPSCSIVQSELPGSDVLIPADGVITGWTVRGASGDVALDVIRPRGGETVRVAQSQWEYAGNPAPTDFETRLAVEAGDQIGVELGPGASIGVTEAEGATTQRWLRPLGGAYGSPDQGEGTGFDYEVAVRAEFVPGERVEPPEHLTGAAAANAPDGRVRERASLTGRRAARDHPRCGAGGGRRAGGAGRRPCRPPHAARVHPGPEARGGADGAQGLRVPGRAVRGGRRVVGEPELRPDDFQLLHRERGEAAIRVGDATAPAGTVVGPFRIERLIGAGSVGAVYVATQVSLRRAVALRLIEPDHFKTPEQLVRFDQEQRLAAALHHPNLVPCYEVGEWEGGRFVAMRLLRGRTVAQLREDGSPPTAASLEPLGGALRAVHDAGLAHGRVSEDNIVVEADGVPYLADLGLERSAGHEADERALADVVSRLPTSDARVRARRTRLRLALAGLAIAVTAAVAVAVSGGDDPAPAAAGDARMRRRAQRQHPRRAPWRSCASAGGRSR